jgi:hypothetical protein
MNPRVSVIIPAYNYARYLPETLSCVTRQTLFDWECILVDDGSTDDTRGLAEAFCRADSRIRYHHQRNLGLPAARNTGVNLSRGQYIQFLDADDLIAAEKLEKNVACMERDPEIDVCYTHYRLLDSASGTLLDPWTRDMLGADPLQDFLFRWELGLCIPIHCALFRRSLWPAGSPFDESLTGKEDWIFWVDLALNRRRFHFLNVDHAFYRLHGQNMFQRHGEMTEQLVHATLKILLNVPEPYRERFIEASLERVRRSLERWATQLRSSESPS